MSSTQGFMGMDMRKGLVAIIATLVASASLATIPNTSSQPNTFLGPTLHLGVVKTITDDTAFAIAGEAGLKNLRLSGTAGWEFDYHQRIKATAEYVKQRLTYAFYDGNQDVWMGQGALGVNYEYDFRQVDPFNTTLDLTAYYSHSPSKGLGVNNYSGASVFKRVAGANAFGIGPGLNIITLGGATVGFDLNYDNVHYNTKYRPALTVKGVGGTLRLSQAITDDVKVGGSAAVRKPFNEYEGNITFGNIEYYGLWAITGFGAYTVGKSTMPSSYNVGLGADYFIDASNEMTQPQPQRPMPKHYKDYKDYKDIPPLVWKEPNVVDKDLLAWVAVPVIHLPVYSVPDQKVVCQSGAAPTALALPIDIGSLQGGTPWTINMAPYFTGGGLTYTLNVITPPTPPVTVSMLGSVITITSDGVASVSMTVSVTASNACGSATSTPFGITD